MAHRAFARAILIVLLTSMFFPTFSIQTVEASGTIYIRADGSIDPITANITSSNNVTYIFTADMNASIVVQRSNITIDGNAYTLQRNGSGHGINVTGVDNVTIKNVEIRAFTRGIQISASSYNRISGTTITASDSLGIWFGQHSSNNTITGNNITANNGYGIWFDRHCSSNTLTENNITANEEMAITFSYYSSHNIIARNTITANKVGIDFVSSSNNTVTENTITANYAGGIWLADSTHNNITENNITNNGSGISLYDSANNSIVRNLFLNDGLIAWESYENVVKDNVVNGKPLVYLEKVSNHTISDAGQVILVNCTNIRVENLTISNTEIGVRLMRTIDSHIARNNLRTNRYGAWLSPSSDNNTITGNNITGNDYNGIWLQGSTHNNITDNKIVGNNFTRFNPIGIRLEGSSNNSIAGNNIAANITHGVYLFKSSFNAIYRNSITRVRYDGIWLEESENNVISANTISESGATGISIYRSSNNILFHNNLVSNTMQASEIDNSKDNTWNNGFEGNYWSSYTGIDANQDGIGDTAHTILSGNNDTHPLMGPFHSFNTTFGKSVNVISNSTVESFEYETSGIIRFSVSNMTEEQTGGFCRVTIPHDALSPPYDVTVNGVAPTYVNYTLHDNGTHRWIYFEYEHSTREIVIIPEFPVWFILPLFMALTLLATAISRARAKKRNES